MPGTAPGATMTAYQRNDFSRSDARTYFYRMPILNIPESYLPPAAPQPELMFYDFRMTEDVIKSKVQLSMHMFSFLRTGRKVVHIEDAFVDVNPEQSLLIRNGNALWTELPDTGDIYCCKLLFFSDAVLQRFLDHHPDTEKAAEERVPYFVIANDAYLQAYIQTLETMAMIDPARQSELLELKFNEILIYLRNKYGSQFVSFLHSIAASSTSGFRQIVEKHVHTALKVREIAFLCNMSLSTFKRHFIETYGQAPGQWYKTKRLETARSLLLNGMHKPSDIYLDFGYNNLSNFSAAFKAKFGQSPREACKHVAG